MNHVRLVRHRASGGNVLGLRQPAGGKQVRADGGHGEALIVERECEAAMMIMGTLTTNQTREIGIGAVHGTGLQSHLSP